jgi:hypothetical protein
MSSSGGEINYDVAHAHRQALETATYFSLPSSGKTHTRLGEAGIKEMPQRPHLMKLSWQSPPPRAYEFVLLTAYHEAETWPSLL